MCQRGAYHIGEINLMWTHSNLLVSSLVNEGEYLKKIDGYRHKENKDAPCLMCARSQI